jgi:hypothetical protein
MVEVVEDGLPSSNNAAHLNDSCKKTVLISILCKSEEVLTWTPGGGSESKF